MPTPVHCAHDKMVPLKDLKPHPKNPNRHPRDQVELLARLIQFHGWRLPITVSNQSGYVVRGHGRLEAAYLVQEKEAPVDFQDYESEEAELADVMADNAIAELSKMDEAQLKTNLIELSAFSFDLEMTGFPQEVLADFLVEEDPPLLQGGGSGGKDPQEGAMVTCPKCGLEFKPS
jgi:ParB-like chromosome segregation protein Spo0J